MKVKIKKIDKNLPLPRYETNGAVAFDYIARKSVKIKPDEIGLVPGNVIIKIPSGYMILITPRSSMPRKTGLVFPHSVGIVDQDYCGQSDEHLIQVFNPTKKIIKIKRGERIAQGVFVKIEKAKWEEVESISKKSRGGFGTTGENQKSRI